MNYSKKGMIIGWFDISRLIPTVKTQFTSHGTPFGISHPGTRMQKSAEPLLLGKDWEAQLPSQRQLVCSNVTGRNLEIRDQTQISGSPQRTRTYDVYPTHNIRQVKWTGSNVRRWSESENQTGTSTSSRFLSFFWLTKRYEKVKVFIFGVGWLTHCLRPCRPLERPRLANPNH